jgi:hypothetical protein
MLSLSTHYPYFYSVRYITTPYSDMADRGQYTPLHEVSQLLCHSVHRLVY